MRATVTIDMQDIARVRVVKINRNWRGKPVVVLETRIGADPPTRDTLQENDEVKINVLSNFTNGGVNG